MEQAPYIITTPATKTQQQPGATFGIDMPASIADQTAFPAGMPQNGTSFGFVGILRHKTGSSDLRSEMHEDADPDARDVAGEV